MRLLKALTIAALSAGLLAAAATATIARPPLEDGTLSVRDGRATIQLRIKGSLIGRLAKGQVVVTDSPDAGTTIIVRGAENERPLSDRTTVYSGRNIRFRIADDRRFVVKLAGKGLNFSAVGRGDGWMDGYGDPEDGVFFDGSYSLNGTDHPTLPNERTRFDLAATPSG
jgi:hypothetical protein